MKFGAEMRPAFFLEDAGGFLNHGSFGAVPKPVAKAQEAWRAKIEAQPVDFMWRRLQPALDDARAVLARFLGTDPNRLAFVDNATAGINAVLRSLNWRAGDEILFTDHVYGAVRQTLQFLADRHGIVPNEVRLPIPIAGPDEVVETVAAALGPKTRLAVLDHIASPSALIFPVVDLIARCRAAGVPVLIDGAHAPGMVPLALDALGADWYAGNCHKWLCAPRGAGFLWARDAHLDDLHPPVISHGYGQGFHAEFDWTGTRDFTPWLAVPAAIDFLDSLGAEDMRHYTHDLAWRAATRSAERWETDIAGPEAMCGSMATVALPFGGPATFDGSRALSRRLWEEHGVEPAIIPLQDRLWARISAHVYNTDEDYDRLGDAIDAVRASV